MSPVSSPAARPPLVARSTFLFFQALLVALELYPAAPTGVEGAPHRDDDRQQDEPVADHDAYV